MRICLICNEFCHILGFMADSATIRTRIDEIDTLLAKGTKSLTIGDRRVDYDLEALQDERARLLRILGGNSQYRRVVFKSA